MKNVLNLTLQRSNAPTLQRFCRICLIIFLLPQIIAAQIDSSAFLCGTEFGSEGSPESNLNCANTSSYWNSNPKYLPNLSYTSLKIRVNLIILQRQDGSGNFRIIHLT